MSAMDSSKSNWFFESELFISDIHFVHSVLAFCTPIISCCKLETSVGLLCAESFSSWSQYEKEKLRDRLDLTHLNESNGFHVSLSRIGFLNSVFVFLY